MRWGATEFEASSKTSQFDFGPLNYLPRKIGSVTNSLQTQKWSPNSSQCELELSKIWAASAHLHPLDILNILYSRLVTDWTRSKLAKAPIFRLKCVLSQPRFSPCAEQPDQANLLVLNDWARAGYRIRESQAHYTCLEAQAKSSPKAAWSGPVHEKNRASLICGLFFYVLPPFKFAAIFHLIL